MIEWKEEVPPTVPPTEGSHVIGSLLDESPSINQSKQGQSRTMDRLVFVLLLAFAAIVESAHECPPNFQFASMTVEERTALSQYVLMGRVTRIIPSREDPSRYGAMVSVSYLFKGVFTNEVNFPVETFIAGFGDVDCRSSVRVRDTRIFFVERDASGGLTAFYAPVAGDGGAVGEAIARIRLDDLRATQSRVNELQTSCSTSLFGCCKDGVTSATGVNFAGCPIPAEAKNQPDGEMFDVREPTAEKTTIDVMAGLKLHLFSTVAFAEEHWCPDRNQVDFELESGAPIGRPMATVFADYPSSTFPTTNFSFVLVTKQSASENAYLFSIHQNGQTQFGLRFDGDRLVVRLSAGDEEVVFNNPGISDDEFHRYAVGVGERTVALYVDCILVGSVTTATNRPPMQARVGDFIVGHGVGGISAQYGGILESIVFTNDRTDAGRLCTIIPDCPPPPPTDPPPTTPSPTTPPPPTTPGLPSTPPPPMTPSPPFADTPTPVSGSDSGSSPASMTSVNSTTTTMPPPPPPPPECGPSKSCPFHGVCNASSGRCECVACSGDVEMNLVCVNGTTYDNECLARRSMCENSFVGKIVPGICDEDETSISGSGDLCERYVCEFSAVCEVTVEGPLCTCNFDCSGVDVANRLCGSDGQDYNSTCHLNKTRCMKMENIVAMSKGRCEERSGTPCNGDDPLETPASCESNSDCPSASYCHVGMTFSRCCPVAPPTLPPTPTLPPDCSVLPFGCCPDRVTPAQGNAAEGCPVEVDLLEDVADGSGIEVDPVDPYCVKLDMAYGITQDSGVTMALIEAFRPHFPRDFSILTTFLTSQSTNAHLLTIYSSTGAIQFALTIDSNMLIVDYAGDKSGQRNQLTFDANLNDGAYHRLAVAVQRSVVTVIVDCSTLEPQSMSRDPMSLFDAMGSVMVGSRLLGAKSFEADVQQLFINPDPSAAFAYCARLEDICGGPTPTPTTAPTTTAPTTKTPTTTAPTTTAPTTTAPTTTAPTTTAPTTTTSSAPSSKPSVPQFSGTNSYVAVASFTRRPDFDLVMEFNARSGDGTLLYVANPDDGSFISVTLSDRVVYFRFNSGSGDVAIDSGSELVGLNEAHTITISLSKLVGKLKLDDGAEAKGKRAKKSDRFDFADNLMYFGGIPETLEPLAVAGITGGFIGCITSVTLLGTAIDFTAAVDMNNAVACAAGPQPPADTTTSTPPADTTTAAPPADTTTAAPPTGPTPLPFIPKFSGSNSYLAQAPFGLQSEFSMDITFNAGDAEGTLFYAGNSANGDFISITMKKREVFFRFNSGSGVVALTAIGKVGKNKVHTVKTSVAKQKVVFQLDGRNKVNGAREKRSDRFEFEADMYYGGYPDDLEVVPDAQVVTGFTGCIQSVMLNSAEVDLGTSTATSNVSSCDL